MIPDICFTHVLFLINKLQLKLQMSENIGRGPINNAILKLTINFENSICMFISEGSIKTRGINPYTASKHFPCIG